MQYETMKSRILPAPFLISNFVKGIKPYTYEEYLIQIVNSSPYFLQKSNGTLYTHPLKEDHGEWDCISPEYAMDFKLVASESLLRALGLFSSQIRAKDSLVCYGAPKIQPDDKRYKPISATRIFAALRALDYNALKEIRGKREFAEPAHRDVCILLKALETNKNLFLFFPYNMYFVDDGSFAEGLEIALKGIGNDFKTSLLYRSDVCPGRDTYLCFIYAQSFIISLWAKGTLQLVDVISVQKSPLFMELYSYANTIFCEDALK